jgi:anti-sigma-K factor RskA
MMMRELDRGELLDRLPEYVRGTLPADERRAVDAALANDPEMVRELDVIRLAHSMLTSRAVPVNVDGIVAAIRQPAPVRRLTAARWRVAAAVAMLAVGGTSLAVIRDFRENREPPTIVGETASVSDDLSVSFGFDLSELSSEDLENLVNELRSSGGVPSAEPKATRVTLDSEGVQ